MKGINRKFLRYVTLNVLSMLGYSAYILADTYFIANGVGENGLVALNLCLPVYSVVIGTGVLLGMGASTRFSMALGANEEEKLTPIFMQAVIFGASAGLILLAAGLLFPEPAARLFGASGETLELSAVYLRTVLFFAPLFIVENILVCFVRNDGNPPLAMAAMLVSSMSNILLDYLFVFPLQMGMFGAALATGFSPGIGLFILSAHFRKGKSRFRLCRCRFLKGELRHIAAAGLPPFLTELSGGVVILVFNLVILGLEGNTGVGAYGIISNIALVCIGMINGVSQGVQPLISRSHGAGEPEKAEGYYIRACLFVFLLGSAIYAAGVFFFEPIVAAFNREESLPLLALAKRGIRLYFTAFFLLGFNVITANFFACVSRPKPAFLLSLLRGFLLVIPLALLLPIFWKMDGVWLAVPVSELLTALLGACFIQIYQKNSKKIKKGFDF